MPSLGERTLFPPDKNFQLLEKHLCTSRASRFSPLSKGIAKIPLGKKRGKSDSGVGFSRHFGPELHTLLPVLIALTRKSPPHQPTPIDIDG